MGFRWTWDEFSVPSCDYSGPLNELVCNDPFAEPNTVRARVPGGTARISITPPDYGPSGMHVEAIDRAGNTSPIVGYLIDAPFSGPNLDVLTVPICGDDARVLLSPQAGVTNVVRYEWTVSNGSSGAVAAGADGTARLRLPVRPQDLALFARSVSANGFVSGRNGVSLNVDPHPEVQGDPYADSGEPAGGVGVAGTFTFRPPHTNGTTAAFEYTFDGGPTQTVAADPDTRSAIVTYTPTRAGSQTLTVSAVPVLGSPPACSTTYTFDVAG